MRALALFLTLGACSPVATSSPDAVGLHADGRGLQPLSTPLRIDFGRSEAGAVAAVTRLLGNGHVERVDQPDCGAGPIVAYRWANGLTLNFRKGAFVGWTSAKGRGSPVATTSGLVPGMPHTALAGASFQETSLGTEFSTGEIHGRVEGNNVDLLWAGVSCFFR